MKSVAEVQEITESPPGQSLAAHVSNGALESREPGTDLMARLLYLAVEKGVDAGSLERLTALHERVSDRQARIAFFGALARFQELCPPIPHSKQVDFVTTDGQKVSYGYAELPAIAKRIAPFLKECGLSYGWDTEAKGDALTVVCTLRHTDGHSERSTFTVPTTSRAGMSPAQKFGAAGTFAKRQSLVQVLGITTESDPDGVQAAAMDPTPISKEQLEALEAEIERRRLNVPRLLKWLKVQKLDEIRAAVFPALMEKVKAQPEKGDQ